MATRYDHILNMALNGTGISISGAKLNFYETGTSTRLDTYSTDDLSTTLNSNPVVADAAGRFGDIFLKAQDYKVVYTDADDVVLVTHDPVHGDTSVDLANEAKKTSIAIWFPGVPGNSAIIAGFVFDRAVTFPADLGTSVGHVLITATDGTTTFNITKNGSNVGTVVWATATNAATFTLASAQAYAIGDYLTVVGPASADSTLGDIMITLQGTR